MMSSHVKKDIALNTPTAPVPTIKTEEALIPKFKQESTAPSSLKRTMHDRESSCDESDDGDDGDAENSPPSKRMALDPSVLDAPPVAAPKNEVKAEPVPAPALKPRNGIMSIKSTPAKAAQRNRTSSTKSKKQPRKGHFGAPDCKVGTMFASRLECSNAAVHLPSVAGISHSNSKDTVPGAYSIVLNNGYEDDVDGGDTVIYTGSGGQPDSYNNAESQVKDQSFDTPANAALKMNCITGKPVRVIRGYKNPSYLAPDKGYRYDGLYKVVKYDLVTGKSGHKICQFILKRLPGQKPLDKLPITF